MTVTARDATELGGRIARGEVSVASVVGDSLRRIRDRDDRIRAFSHVDSESAIERARKLDSQRARGESPGPLFGIPIAIKANLCLAGRDANCGSRLLADYRPPYTATAVQRVIDAGAVVLGHTHMDEFGMGSSGENCAFATTANPWDETRTPGGSSSGSAAAVAAQFASIALGSDTGGSVRQPAAFCGLTGFKPSFGRVSRYGLVAFGSSLDQVGAFAQSARDLERVLSVIAGRDARDSVSSQSRPFQPASTSPSESSSLQGLRLGIPAEFFGDALASDVRASVGSALDEFVESGAQLVDVPIPHIESSVAAYYIVATAEASSNLSRFDGVRFGERAAAQESLRQMMCETRARGFGEEVRRRILLGTFALSAGYSDKWYGRAQRVRALLARDFERAFERVDLLVGPTAPTTAFPLGSFRQDPLAMYLSDIMTVPASLAGLPAASVPCRTADGLPVGLQLIGRRGDDERVLAVARDFQAVTRHHLQRPDSPRRDR